MALQSGGLIQDENLNFHYNGPSVAAKANALNSQIKSGPRGRKPLGDLSNLRTSVLNQSSKKKPDLHEASKKKKQSLKVSTVTKESLHHSAVFEEGFLHNHEECIKAQNSSVYINHLDFLRSIGLDAPKEVATLTKKVDDSPWKLSDLPEEMEWSDAYCSPRGKSLEALGSPISSKLSDLPEEMEWPDPFPDLWKHSDIVDFSLIGSPSRPKLA